MRWSKIRPKCNWQKIHVCTKKSTAMKAALRVFLINFCSGLFCDVRDRSDLFLLKMCSVPCENGHGLRYQS